MMKIKPAFLLSTILISACSTLSEFKPPIEDSSPPAQPLTIESFDANVASVDANPFYDVLVGEFAGQRGQFDQAFQHYWNAAEQTNNSTVAKRATQMAILAKNPQAAEKGATTWAELSPKDPQPIQVLILMNLRQNDEAAASTNINRLLSITGGTDKAFVSIATLLEKNTSKEAALRIMQEVASHYPDEAAAFHAHAKMVARANQPARALEIVKLGLLKQADDERLIQLHAQLIRQLHGPEKEISYLQDVLSKKPDLHDIRLYYARLLVRLKQNDDARKEFERLAKAQPDNANLLFSMGLLSLQIEDFEQAKSYLQSAAPKLNDVNQQRAHYYLGQVEEQLDHPDKALKWFEKVRTGEFAFDAVLRSAVLLAQMDKMPEAIGLLHSLHVNSKPQAVKLILLESELLSKNGKTDDAIIILTRSLKRFPDEIDILYARGMLLESIDELDKMEADMRRIIDLEPNHIHAINSLGYTLADRTDRIKEALELVQRAHRLQPDNPYVLDSVGWAYYRAGNHAKSIEFLRKALTTFPDTEVYLHLTEVLWESGQQQEAKAVLKRALAEAPDDKRLKKFQQKYKTQ